MVSAINYVDLKKIMKRHYRNGFGLYMHFPKKNVCVIKNHPHWDVHLKMFAPGTIKLKTRTYVFVDDPIYATFFAGPKDWVRRRKKKYSETPIHKRRNHIISYKEKITDLSRLFKLLAKKGEGINFEFDKQKVIKRLEGEPI